MQSKPQFQILLVEDDPLIAESLRSLLPSHWRLEWIQKFDQGSLPLLYHAALVDMHLTSDKSLAQGPGVIRKLKETHSHLQVVAISGDLSLSLMEESLEAGASRFLSKPLLKDEVLSVLEKIEAWWMLRKLESAGSSTLKWVGTSSFSEHLRKQVASLKGEKGPILIEGETGTGKEVVFRLLNQQETGRPAVTVNMSALPEDLFESEMFGSVKGAFTGADTNRVGLVEAAQGGDLFLDEIEAMPLAHQAKLLRFLETGEFKKVGAKDIQYARLRVIAATNKNLEVLVKEGLFREDLLFRLNGKKIKLAPLREHPEDIPALAKHFLSLEKPKSNKSFSLEALERLRQYPWPGNVRELKRVCEQVALVAPLPILRPSDLDPLLSPGVTPPTPEVQIDFSEGLVRLVENYEAWLIKNCLKKVPDVEEASNLLKVSRSNLYKKIKDYGIE